MVNVFFNKTATQKAMAIVEEIAEGTLDWLGLTDTELVKANHAVSLEQTVAGCVAKSKRVTNLGIHIYQSVQIVRANSKTGCAVDFSNQCPFMLEGKGCDYCYMAEKINQGRIKGREWAVCSEYLTPTKENLFRAFLKRFKRVAPGHFLRFFGMSDVADTHIGLMIKLLDICKSEGVKTTVITKNPLAAKAACNFASSVNYSVDNGNYNSPSSISQYVELRKEFPDIRMFGMVVDYNDIRLFENWMDVYNIPKTHVQLVAYHGSISRIQSSASTVIKPMFLNILTNGYACCANGLCIGCPLQCGVKGNKEMSPTFKFHQRG